MRIELGFGIGLTKAGKPIPALETRLTAIIVQASNVFGGCNLVRGMGGWKPNGLPFVLEESATLTILSAFTSTSPEGLRVIHQVRALAEYIRKDLFQDSVLLSWHDVQIDGTSFSV